MKKIKLTKKNISSVYKVYSDCGIKTPEYIEAMAELHDIFNIFDGENEVELTKEQLCE